MPITGFRCMVQRSSQAVRDKCRYPMRRWERINRVVSELRWEHSTGNGATDTDRCETEYFDGVFSRGASPYSNRSESSSGPMAFESQSFPGCLLPEWNFSGPPPRWVCVGKAVRAECQATGASLIFDIEEPLEEYEARGAVFEVRPARQIVGVPPPIDPESGWRVVSRGKRA